MSRGRSSRVAGGVLQLTLRRQELSQDDGGHACWREIVEPASYACAQTALLLCDMWDRHWSRGATGRVDAMVPRMNEVATAARDSGAIAPWQGVTDIFIYPGFAFRVTDALMTNFHLPKSTLMMLVSALMGRERMMGIYEHAISERYRFFSYGDSSLLIP